MMNDYKISFTFTEILILLLPVSLLLFSPAAEAVLVILVIIGIYRLANKDVVFSRIEWGISAGFLLLYGSIVLSIMLESPGSEGFKEMGSNIHFLLSPLFIAAINQKKLLSILVASMRIAILLAFVMSIYQRYFVGLDRAAGTTSATVFAYLIFAFTFAQWINELKRIDPGWGRDNIASFNIWTARFIFFIGLYAAFLTQTRLVWILIIVMPVLLVFYFRSIGAFARWILETYVIVFLVAALFALLGGFEDRILITVENIRFEFSTASGSTSIGQRLSMWKGGVLAANESLLWGYGLDQTVVASSQFLPDEQGSLLISKGHQHLHNDYINTMTGMGLIGLSCFLYCLLLPLAYFARIIKSRITFQQSSIGFVFIVSLLLISLTDSIYTSTVMRTFWVTFTCIILCSNDAKPKLIEKT